MKKTFFKHKTLLTLLACSPLAGALCAQDDLKTVYIEPYGADGAPGMPQMKIHAGAIENHKDAKIMFRSSSEHKMRAGKDDVDFVIEEPHKVLPPSLVWNAGEHFKGRIFGGKITITAKTPQKELHSVSIRLRGKNPDAERVKEYVQKHCGEHWYAWAVAQHESRQGRRLFNQFNTDAYKKLEGIPNHGAPDGWGIMQLDSKRGTQISTEEVYNWQANVKSGIALMDAAKKEASAYFNAVKRTFPDKWEQPPASFVPHGCKTKLSALDAAVIQMYNGAAVVRKLKTPFGTRCHYRSAWDFDENAPKGSRWKFKTNQHDYVFKVIHNEFEGKI